ncbi:preprotein translocase subunit SecY [Streptomyces sp. NPDC056480]|uniref:preprotein translocase subunit SecY n=1 Tax=Streptomyces sp. NPDC056480 TaxID=3345833 RepID=UPI00368CBD08
MLARVLRVSAVRRRLLWTLLAVVLFRLGQNLPLPGVRGEASTSAAATAGSAAAEADGGGQRLHGLVELLTGGGLGQLSVVTFGIVPVLAARLVMEVVGPVVPRVRLLAAAGSEGAAVIARWTRWLAVLLAAGFGVWVAGAVTGGGCVPLTGICGTGGPGLLHDRADGPVVAVALVATMAAGTAVVLRLAGLITARGVGEGLSVLFLAQLGAVVPGQVASAARETGGARGTLVLVAVVLALLAMTAVVVVVLRSERRIPLQRAERMVGRSALGPTPTYVPVRGGQDGFVVMIPASLLLLVPAPAGPWLLPLYVLVVFAYVGLRARVEPAAPDLADRLKRSGLFVPGVRTGPQTAQYIAYVQSRIGLTAALAMAGVALVPVLALAVLDGPAGRFALSATTLLIVVSAAVRTALPAVRQMESLAVRQAYGPLLR